MSLGTFRAAILNESCQPLVVDSVDLPSRLAPGQVLVRLRFSGICGAQINEIDAVKGPDKFLPHLLGHEGLAEVLDTGELVRHVHPGDRVVLHWMPGEGIQSEPPRYKWRGRELNAGWVTTFNEMAVVSGNRCTRVSTLIDEKLLPMLGCAATTAVGVVGREANVRLGDTVVVLGTGGVGLLVVQAAKASGAATVVGVDRSAGRLQSARLLGADQTVLTESGELYSAVLRAIQEDAPDVVIETTGARSMIELASELVAHGGRAILVGVPRHDEPASIHTLPLHFGARLTGSKGGGTDPVRDVRRIVRLAERGLFRLDSLPVSVYTLDEVNQALDHLRSELPGRAVLDMRSS